MPAEWAGIVLHFEAHMAASTKAVDDNRSTGKRGFVQIERVQIPIPGVGMAPREDTTKAPQRSSKRKQHTAPKAAETQSQKVPHK